MLKSTIKEHCHFKINNVRMRDSDVNNYFDPQLPVKIVILLMRAKPKETSRE